MASGFFVVRNVQWRCAGWQKQCGQFFCKNLKKWFDAGAVCVGMGSKLMAKDAAGNCDLEKIREMTRQCLVDIGKIRGKVGG